MNKSFIALLFLLSTSFFIIQHSTGYSWDFTVFSLNSRYFLTGRGFFEWPRPPLPAFLMIFGEYLFIILVSLLGLFACLKFAKTYDLKPEVFYAFILTPHTLAIAFSVSSEYLLLSLTILLFAYIKTELSGLFASLLFLTQYRAALSSIFVFFSGKKFLKSIIIALIVLTPWFLFNYLLKGSPFFSFVDQYALNVAMRNYVVQPVDFSHFFLVASFMVPLFLFGLYSFKRDQLIDWLMIFYLGVMISSYVFVPLKISRYLYTMVLPVAYFSTRALDRFNHRTAYFVALISLFSLPIINPFINLEDPGPFIDSLSYINSSCMVQSNDWVYLNYFGVNAGPAPREQLISKRLAEGYQIVLFKFTAEPSYVFNESFMSNLPIVNETEHFFVLRNDSVCFPSFYYNVSYVEALNRTLLEIYNESFSYTIWDVIS